MYGFLFLPLQFKLETNRTLAEALQSLVVKTKFKLIGYFEFEFNCLWFAKLNFVAG